jgi:hypothetical protein
MDDEWMDGCIYGWMDGFLYYLNWVVNNFTIGIKFSLFPNVMRISPKKHKFGLLN